MKDENNDSSPPSDNTSLVKRDEWQLEEVNTNEVMLPLEGLLESVSHEIVKGHELKDILRRRPLSKIDPTTGKELMPTNQYADYLMEFYSTRTSKGHNPAIGIRNLRSDIWDVVYLITRSPDDFPEKACRTVSIVETCMIHVGLHGLDLLLIGRPKVVKDRLNGIRKGAKEKRRKPRLGPYRFVNFIETMEKQQNIWCLSPEDYARVATIAEDYGWDMGFVVQMAMIFAISNSTKLPKYLRNDAAEEVGCFKNYLNNYIY